MKTITESGFSKVENEALKEKLLQLTHEFPIAYIFYHIVNTTEPAHIIIITSRPKYVDVIESRKWIRNRRNQSNVLFHVTSQKKMEAEFRAGNPFIALYCQKSTIVYQKPQVKECSDTDWHLFKRKFKKYVQGYYHDRDILLFEGNLFQRLGSLTGMFLSYRAVFEYAIRYLEILYIGHQFESTNLHQRIKQLAHFIPGIERVFVRKNGNEYYLVSELERGKEAAEYGDEIRLNDSLFDSIVEAELKLYKIVSGRLSYLKRKIKSGAPLQTIAVEPGPSPEDKDLTQIISQIITIHPVEEIYLFQQTQNHRTTTNFLLLIGEGLGTAILRRIQQAVTAKSESKLAVVLLGHSRIWVQTNLFYQQSFFKKIMVPDNLRFQSHQNHPSIHWEKPHTPDYPDLEHYYRSSVRQAAQYFVLRDNSEKDNTEGLSDLFGKSVLRIFRTFVFSKLSYLPNYLPAFNLWKLCVYAEPKLEKLEFLFEKCSGENFFKEVGCHTKFYHGISRLTKGKLQIMDEILRLLLQELETACNSIKDMDTGDMLVGSEGSKD